jgi:DNA-binding transcriptional LysR family regulator
LVPLLAEYQERSDDDRFYLLYLRGRTAVPRVRAVVEFLARRLGPPSRRGPKHAPIPGLQ